VIKRFVALTRGGDENLQLVADFSWPTYSSSCLGRKARSSASSLAEAGVAAMMRCSENRRSGYSW